MKRHSRSSGRSYMPSTEKRASKQRNGQDDAQFGRSANYRGDGIAPNLPTYASPLLVVLRHGRRGDALGKSVQVVLLEHALVYFLELRRNRRICSCAGGNMERDDRPFAYLAC